MPLPQPAPSHAFQQFVQQCSQLAVRAGISAVVIAAKDPHTGVATVVASPTGATELAAVLAEKLHLQTAGGDMDGALGEVGWGDDVDAY